jgi:hypothetical protein
MAFAPCRVELPLLRPATGPADGQQVACHLYDPRHTASAPPTAQEFAAGYELAYASGRGERSGQ